MVNGPAERVESILTGYAADVEAVTSEFLGKLQEATELLDSVEEEARGELKEPEPPVSRRRRGPDLFE